MDKEIFHRIVSAGLTFTSEEWGEYCRRSRKDPAERIVTSMGKYDFNDCDVCINPDTMTLKIDDKKTIGYSVTLKLANCGNGLWVYGVDYSTGDGGGGFSPCYVTPDEKKEWLKGYPTERECRMAACDCALSRLDHCGKKNAKVERLREMVIEYKKMISRPKVVQLSLF